ncbi:hypothetical protein BUE80_DR006601 [Diplocarpon rosae]|nr:hypothetical protein BUE80_DR006601 [Diplocarpon rosae]
MAPKHGLAGPQTDEQLAKRSRGSATPADTCLIMPFQVEYPVAITTRKPASKEKERTDSAEWQVSPFNVKGAKEEGELDQYYAVTPHEEWESMRTYSNFVIQGEVYRNNQLVFVRGPDTPKDRDTEGRPKDFWVARILQVRAKNAQHVYALVAWMYWPEEIAPPAQRAADQVNKASGKRTYHGKREMVASNYMEVLDVLTFAGRAEVPYWDEDDEHPPETLYRRQTYNRLTEGLSSLKQRCTCNGYYNPDVDMMICDNPQCKIYFHRNHLVDDILKKVYDREIGEAKGNPAGKGKGRILWKGKFKATIEYPDVGTPEAVIDDLRPDKKRTWNEPILCPVCDYTFE